MADRQHRGDTDDFEELARAVHELSLRVQRLERRLGGELANNSADSSAQDAQQTLSGSRPRSTRLESQIGSQWLNRIGVIAVLFGVAYLLRYAFVREWVSVAAWIWLGVCAGLAIIVGSEWFRRRGYRVLSLSLKATGIGIGYLSLWAGSELYKLLSGLQTFSGLLLLAVLTAVLALRESAEVLAALALIAGFLTPLLISIPSGKVTLFLYVAMLNCATATVVLNRSWWKLLAVSFAGTLLICTTWYFRHYTQRDLLAAALGATVFFAIFAATAALVRPRLAAAPASRLLTFIEVTNPVLYLGGLYLLANHLHQNALTALALGLSGLYFALARKEERRMRFGTHTFVLVYAGMGIAFLAVTLAILLPVAWLSLGWFVEAAVVMAIGFSQDSPWLRSGALLLLCAAVIKAFAYDVWRLPLGYRTLSFIGLGVLLLIISFAYQRYGFLLIAKPEKDPTDRLR